MFATNPKDLEKKNENTIVSWFNKFSSQPHQPFFSGAIFFFLLFLFLLTFQYSNIINLDSSVLVYHAYTMIFVVFIQFFLGFLFVVFPKFLMQEEIKSKIYMKHFYAYFVFSLMIFLSLIFFSKLLVFFQVALFLTQVFSFILLFKIHRKSKVEIKNDSKWVLIGYFSGLIGHFLFILSSFNFSFSYELSKLSVNIGFYLFLLVIVFTISQRMIPFFTRSVKMDYVINKSKNLLLFIYVLLFLKVIFLSFNFIYINLFIDIALFILISKELLKWKLPLFKVPAIMWVLYLALYWLPIGFFIAILESLIYLISPSVVFEKAVLHIFALGYFSTALIGFGTRVILGHSGNRPFADKFTIAIFLSL